MHGLNTLEKYVIIVNENNSIIMLELEMVEKEIIGLGVGILHIEWLATRITH